MPHLINKGPKEFKRRVFGSKVIIPVGKTYEVTSDKKRKAVLALAKAEGIRVLDVAPERIDMEALLKTARGEADQMYAGELESLRAAMAEQDATIRALKTASRAIPEAPKPVALEDAPPPVVKAPVKKAPKKKAPKKKAPQAPQARK